MTNRRVLTAAIGVAFAVAGAGCGSDPSTGQVVQSSKSRILAPQSADLAQLVTDNSAFAVDLYQALRLHSGNMVFSPESISIALAMTYGGAAGTTATQMATTLHFALPAERLHPAFDALDLALTAPAAMSGAFQLNLANALWAQQGFTMQPSFLDLLAENYGAGVRLVDFARATEQARQSINHWVSVETAGRIPELLMMGVLDPSTVLVLTNAVYFKADWQMPFPPNSGSGTFNAPAGPVTVPMMLGEFAVPVWSGPGYSATALPYAGGTASMVLIVPDAGTFDTFEAALTADTLATIVAGSAGVSGGVLMPRFTFDQRFSLGDTLQSMGMTDAFDDSRADFSGIDGQRDLVISDVIHQANIAVDEQGTVATAATAVVITLLSAMTPSLRVDRPFIFLIRDDATGSILFMGRVLDPSQ